MKRLEGAGGKGREGGRRYKELACGNERFGNQYEYQSNEGALIKTMDKESNNVGIPPVSLWANFW